VEQLKEVMSLSNQNFHFFLLPREGEWGWLRPRLHILKITFQGSKPQSALKTFWSFFPLAQGGLETYDLSKNDLSKDHVRFLAGGHANVRLTQRTPIL
jgi:hypothetical protein